MKKFFTLLFSLVVVAVSAQSISLSADTINLRHGDKIDYGSFIIKNNAGSQIDIDCTIRPMCYNPDDDALIAICFGTLCFSPVNVETTFGELTMEPVTTIGAGGEDNTFKLESFSGQKYGSVWEVDFFDQANPTDKTTLVVYIDVCDASSSTSDIYEKVNFTASPNPASDFLNLTFEEGNVQRVLNIYNTIGQLQDSEIISSGAFTHRKDISKLTSGNYFIQVISDDGATAVKKLVVR